MRGSLINRLAENSTNKSKPEVGMGVTILMYTDRSAGTIQKVHENGKRFWFQMDKAIRIDNNGMSDSQSYRFEPNPESKMYECFLNKHGQWVIKNKKDGPGLGGTKVAVGYRSYYHDYSF